MEHRDEGFTVVAFPCNQFGNQEPDSNEGILEFCQNNYDVTFPIMAKGDVKEENASPLWQWLGENAKNGGIYWNFHKFLIGRDGNIIDNWEMDEEMEPVIEAVKANLS
jgi:glutathione peroxidase